MESAVLNVVPIKEQDTSVPYGSRFCKPGKVLVNVFSTSLCEIPRPLFNRDFNAVQRDNFNH